MRQKNFLKQLCILVTSTACTCSLSHAQSKATGPFTHPDTLRGTITAGRAWWDVKRYDIHIKPDYIQKYTTGYNTITYSVTKEKQQGQMQIDLQIPLHIDSVQLDRSSSLLSFTRDGKAWFIKVPKQRNGSRHQLKIYYSGKPHEAIRAPWDGGWTFGKDSLGRPWMTVTCQGLGASIWYPCKDHQSDEPDDGASLTMTVPDTLFAVSNGRLQYHKNNKDGTATYSWAVVNPINNYDLIPYIGKYVNFSEVYNGEKGRLDLNYWVLDYNLPRAKNYLPDQVHRMLKAFEYWFGPYPFYEDGYKLIDVPHTGMEHQSGIAYGNRYAFGYRGRDDSHTGYGLQSDFIIVHESAHEWFGNNITSQDLADMWIHESFANYAETLYVDYYWRAEAGNSYNFGVRKGISNTSTIIPPYNVNSKGSGDMYPKGGNMLQLIRHSLGDDSRFRQIMRGLNTTFYHQTVTAKEVEDYISLHAGFDYNKIFEQYLLNTQIPVLEYAYKNNEFFYKWDSCIKGFNLPLTLKNDRQQIKIFPTGEWKSSLLPGKQFLLLNPDSIERMYYIRVRKSNE